jgi:ribonuclease HII
MTLATYYDEGIPEAGCDEAGRGCLAGPVFAAAVIWPPGLELAGLDDSKKLTAARREALRPLIERQALCWAVAEVSAAEIDRINILNASFLAMSRAIEGLARRPQALLIDGNRFRSTLDIPFRCIVGGDGKYAAIAAASVLAKTHRDAYMERIDAEFPAYGWRRNKGYPTADHRRAVAAHGLSPHHRLTFNGGYGQPTLF